MESPQNHLGTLLLTLFMEMLGNRNSLFLALPRLSVPNVSTLKSSKHVPHKAFAPLGKTGKIQSQMFGLVRHSLPFPQSAFSVLIFSHHLLVETTGLSSDEKNLKTDKRIANISFGSFAILNYSFQKGSRVGSSLTGLCRC